MKRVWIAFLVAVLVCMTACGVQHPAAEGTDTETQMEDLATNDAIDADITVTESLVEDKTEEAKTTLKPVNAGDWKTAYEEYLESLTEDSENVSSLEYVEYAFVTMPGLDYPVLVVFGGWRDFYFYTFKSGKIVTARQDYEDGEGDLIEAWVDMPVYYLDGCLYFNGGNGAPATIFTDEVSVKDGALQSERVASKLCASAFGDRDYYHGRGEPEITESEYNTIVNNIKKKGKEVEFRSLKDLKG